MSVLGIRLWPDPVLGKCCAPVTEDVSDLVTDLFDTMYAAPGRGLAAPQVGVPLRLFVMDCGWKEGEGTPIACINPEIIAASDDMAGGEEACLSIPGVAAEVMRPAAITLRYTDPEGRVQERQLSGIEAKCAQHEFDHLEGKVIFDRLDSDTAQSLQLAYDEARTRG